ncbi:beta-galactosidase [Catenuloplanes nepalensis]|uniref:Beta-galactosidase n=1 Tax=Catenuloplanes nepalensis TaxID=587533 RepID=A0ABT9MS89_9ACTN|nr:beta-galactosidase [Catenuloplanes nepalensis]MDP9794146.1 beta-galactosidase [Catenuloplanes nepalensis]
MTIYYGGDYNPEQWPEQTWAEDVRLMTEAGVNLVTVGVFSWAMLEPADGQWDFGWLDRILDLLHANGIRVDLATATASPPPWLTAAHPEMLPADEAGQPLWPGSRQHYAPSSPVYRRHALRLVRAMAERYGNHPALEMWHINNEYGCHTNLDYSAPAAVAFRDWLRDRYTGIDALNQAWATAFWSQRYAGFDEILPPRQAPSFRNPTQLLDFHRFSSDMLLECFLAEKDVLREITPDVPVTTNFIGAFKPVDYWRWAPHVDIVSDDNYYDPADARAPMRAAFSRDLMRGLAGAKSWMLMEQATGHVQWRPTNLRKPTGQMRAVSLQAVARGADGINFFQWRQSRGGAEKFHSAMLPHIGTESRVWRSVVGLGADLVSLKSVAGIREIGRVAVVFDWDSWWGLEGEALPRTFDYVAGVEDWYEALYALNLQVDVVSTAHDLSPYAAVFAPHLYVLPDTAAENLAGYVARGGSLLLTYGSGLVDQHDQAHLGGYLGGLRDTAGLLVEEFGPLAGSTVVEASGDRLGTVTGTLWTEFLQLRTAKAVARFHGGDLDGEPAVTRNTTGNGLCWYVATRPDPAAIARITAAVLADAAVATPLADLPAGVEAQTRGDLLFLINHNPHPISTPHTGRDVLTGTTHDPATLPGYGAVALDRGSARL